MPTHTEYVLVPQPFRNSNAVVEKSPFLKHREARQLVGL